MDNADEFFISSRDIPNSITSYGRCLTGVFYTKDSISPYFYDGTPITHDNVDADWKLHITEYNGQWFTLNNRLLYAIKSMNHCPGHPSRSFNMAFSRDVVIVPYEEVINEFHSKFTTTTNGNVCYVEEDDQGSELRADIICSEYTNRDLYFRFISDVANPTLLEND